MPRFKTLILTLIFFILISPLSLNAKVRVLSVCVGTYPQDSGWAKISSVNDNTTIKNVFGNDVPLTSLLDAEATFDGFTRALTNLEKTSQPGDTVIVHFSGHGQQILTPNSSLEEDKVDEAMIPYDAYKKESDSYTGQNHFTDDIFGGYVTKIRKKVGYKGLVIAVIDACHSDSMDKDADDSCIGSVSDIVIESDHSNSSISDNGDRSRGSDLIFGTKSLSKEEIKALKEHYYKKDDSPVITSEQLSDVIFIGACGTHQRNYEIKRDGQYYGSLSYYFCKAVKDKGLSNMDLLLTEIYNNMAKDRTLRFHGQTPKIRTTLQWQKPKSDVYVPEIHQGSELNSNDSNKGSSDSDDNSDSSSDNSNNWSNWILCSIGVFVLILIITILSFIIRKWKK